jgi:hypothetical protein
MRKLLSTVRTKLPVTEREYQFPGRETLLSDTDTNKASHISYANAAFIWTSGYAPCELMEQSSTAASSMGDQAQRLVDAVKVFSF